jgi:sugar/nucleoside kinase (ribokinase family)
MASASHVYCLSAVSLDRVFQIDHIPSRDEKVLAEGMEELAGGQGLWAARALAAWGAPVTFVTGAGDDAEGRRLQAEISAIDGLGLQMTLHPRQRTETCVILVDRSGEKALVLAPTDAGLLARLGDDLRLTPGDVVTANVFHPNLRRVFERARAGGGATLLDLEAPAIDAWGWDLALSIVEQADIVCTNGAMLVRWAAQEGIGGDLGARAGALAAFLGRRTPRVCVTLGADGVLAWEAGRAFHLPAEPVKLRNSTGAGDTFLAGLALGTLRRWPFADAVRLASAAAAVFLSDGHGLLGTVHDRYRRLGGNLSWPG